MRILVTGGSGFIGTNLIDKLIEQQIQVVNLDINPPKKESQVTLWRHCDILDFNLTRKIFETFKPTHVVHLAARTDTLSNDLDEYMVNTKGTSNLLQCVLQTSTVERLVITSSQFVFAPPGLPKSDDDYYERS